MINAVRNFISTVEMPKLVSPKQFMTNVAKVALPAIALVSLAYANSAEAGPIAYAACIASCSAGTFGIGTPACLAGCLPLLMAPTP